MPPKKLTAKQARAALPEWSQKIVDFRNSLKLSQSELGKQLGASTMAVSRWERAIQKAPANIYIERLLLALGCGRPREGGACHQSVFS